jgi:orotate phosphoribosyltransferase-like protein
MARYKEHQGKPTMRRGAAVMQNRCAEALALRESGMTLKQIGDAVGVGDGTAYKMVQRAKLQQRSEGGDDE